MCLFYPTKSGPHDDVLAMLLDVYSKHPEAQYFEPYEVQSLLWSLGYTDELLDESEIAAAIEVGRSDYELDEGVA
jgi:hypothetical protein